MGNLKLALFLAFKAIVKGNRWAIVLIILVMSLSFANLLLTPSIIWGVTETLNRQQIETTYGNIIIDPPAGDSYLRDASIIEQKVGDIPGVTGAAARLNYTAHIEYQWGEKNTVLDQDKSGNWPVAGVDPTREASVTNVSQHMLQGSYLDENDRQEILLGVEIAGGSQAETAPFLTLQGVQVGDLVRLTYPNGVQREYRVKGIFKVREMGETDRMAFVARKEMASVMGRIIYRDRASQVLVAISQAGTEPLFINQIKSLGIDGQVRSWADYGGSIGGMISSFNVIASLINSIGLIVAGVVMFIVIYINVLNKRRQIGILRAIGIKRSVIIGAYLTQAFFYAVLGIVFGGLLFGYVIQPYFSVHPLDLAIGQVSLAVQMGSVQNAVIGLIGATVLAGLIPVLSITRQRIIQAIWGS